MKNIVNTMVNIWNFNNEVKDYAYAGFEFDAKGIDQNPRRL